MTCTPAIGATGPSLARIADRPRLRSRLLALLVAGYVLLLPYQFEVSKTLNFAPADCFLLLALLLVPGQLKFRSSVWNIWHLGIPLAFLASSMVAALRFGEIASYEFLNKDLGLLLPFLSYAAITTVASDWEMVRRIMRIFVLTIVAENTVAVCGFLAHYFLGVVNPFARYGGMRLSGMLLDPNAYGGLLIAAIAMCEGASWGRAPLFRGSILWFARCTLIPGLLFTFSRSAWIGLGISLLLFCAIRPALALRPVMAALAGAPVLFLLMGSRFVPIFEVMASRPKQVQGRFDLIQWALDAFVERPFFGGGLGSFRLANGEVAHNSAMWFLADFGLLGLVMLAGFLGWFFVKGWYAWRFAPARERPLALGLLLAHAALLGLAMGIEAFYQRHWWLIFALIASSYALARQNTATARETEVLADVSQ